MKSIEVGRILPRFVTPTDVRDLKNRLNAFVLGEDAAVDDCVAIPTGPRAGWKSFVASWQSYFAEDDSWLRAGAQMDEGEAYEADLAQWQSTIATYKCAGAAPPVSSLDPPFGGNDPREPPSAWPGAVKTVAIAGIAVALAMSLRAASR